jgi:hypothetical protein
MLRMPNATVRRAVIAKRADVESKRLRALATAWELESTEKHAMLLQSVLRDKAEEYVDSMAETTFFERLLAKRSMQQLEDDADFTVAAYTHDLAAHQIADEQLNHLEEIGVERGMHLPLDSDDPSEGASDDAEVRLDECLESILNEASNLKVIQSFLSRYSTLYSWHRLHYSDTMCLFALYQILFLCITRSTDGPRLVDPEEGDQLVTSMMLQSYPCLAMIAPT